MAPNVVKKPIRVFLVDDSPLALVMLKRMLATAPEIEVVGTARGGREALEQFEAAQPDVICTDYLMPDMDGLALIQRTMEVFPRPILVISSTIDPTARQQAFPLLAAGAVDVLAKPRGHDSLEHIAAELVQKIRLLSGVSVISRRAPGSVVAAANALSKAATTAGAVLSGAVVARPTSSSSAVGGAAAGGAGRTQAPGASDVWTVLRGKTHSIRIVAVGASTGGPQVLQTLFSSLPAGFPCPIVCVQHISPGFLGGLVDWLHTSCRVQVKIAEGGELARPGVVYFPPENTHLEVDRQGHLSCSQAPPVDGHKPSVTATFESVALHYGNSALGILLTGMGSDGASGLESMARAGGITIAQDEASCVVFGMPKQAISRGAAQFILPPALIASALIRLTAKSLTAKT